MYNKKDKNLKGANSAPATQGRVATPWAGPLAVELPSTLGDLVGGGEGTLVGIKSTRSDSRLGEVVPRFSRSQEEGLAIVVLRACWDAVGKSVLISSWLRMALEGKRHGSGNQLEVDLVEHHESGVFTTGSEVRPFEGVEHVFDTGASAIPPSNKASSAALYVVQLLCMVSVDGVPDSVGILHLGTDQSFIGLILDLGIGYSYVSSEEV